MAPSAEFIVIEGVMDELGVVIMQAMQAMHPPFEFHGPPWDS
jgi:hypothetical protein